MPMKKKKQKTKSDDIKSVAKRLGADTDKARFEAKLRKIAKTKPASRMRVIELNAKPWRNPLDYYDALKEALGSCRGHGSSPDAWVDSMLYGGMNEIEPPYVIRISGAAACPAGVRDAISELQFVISEARKWKKRHYGKDTDVSFDVRH